jgi:putative endonuclease
MDKWYVYILRCNDGRLYTGMTNDVERRFLEHKAGKGGHFTGAFGAAKLLYTEGHPSRSAALKREYQLKGLTRKAKLALIRERGRKSSGNSIVTGNLPKASAIRDGRHRRAGE